MDPNSAQQRIYKLCTTMLRAFVPYAQQADALVRKHINELQQEHEQADQKASAPTTQAAPEHLAARDNDITEYVDDLTNWVADDDEPTKAYPQESISYGIEHLPRFNKPALASWKRHVDPESSMTEDNFPLLYTAFMFRNGRIENGGQGSFDHIPPLAGLNPEGRNRIDYGVGDLFEKKLSPSETSDAAADDAELTVKVAQYLITLHFDCSLANCHVVPDLLRDTTPQVGGQAPLVLTMCMLFLVELNTASQPLLQDASGLSPELKNLIRSFQQAFKKELEDVVFSYIETANTANNAEVIEASDILECLPDDYSQQIALLYQWILQQAEEKRIQDRTKSYFLTQLAHIRARVLTRQLPATTTSIFVPAEQSVNASSEQQKFSAYVAELSKVITAYEKDRESSLISMSDQRHRAVSAIKGRILESLLNGTNNPADRHRQLQNFVIAQCRLARFNSMRKKIFFAERRRESKFSMRLSRFAKHAAGQGQPSCSVITAYDTADTQRRSISMLVELLQQQAHQYEKSRFWLSKPRRASVQKITNLDADAVTDMATVVNIIMEVQISHGHNWWNSRLVEMMLATVLLADQAQRLQSAIEPVAEQTAKATKAVRHIKHMTERTSSFYRRLLSAR